jgi:hypothetical protein
MGRCEDVAQPLLLQRKEEYQQQIAIRKVLKRRRLINTIGCVQNWKELDHDLKEVPSI